MTKLATAEERLRRLIDAKAAWFSLPMWLYASTFVSPGALLEALVLTESSGNPRAIRYEPHQDRATRKDAASDPDTADRDDGNTEDDKSYGLTQVMGSNARVVLGAPSGTLLNFDRLFEPDLNLHCGCMVLTWELKAVAQEVAAGKVPPGKNVERALCRYNGGPSGDDPDPQRGGAFRLQAYVDKVGSHALAVVSDRSSSHWI